MSKIVLIGILTVIMTLLIGFGYIEGAVAIFSIIFTLVNGLDEKSK